MEALDYIMENGRCPICDLFPRPDMTPFICKNGHQICGPCGLQIRPHPEKRVKLCPMCRGEFEQTSFYPESFSPCTLSW